MRTAFLLRLLKFGLFLNILNLIRKDTERVIIVQIDGRDDGDVIVSTAKELMPLEKTEMVDRWFGTKAPGRAAVQYTFLKKRAFFNKSLQGKEDGFRS